MAIDLNEVLNQVKALSSAEQRELRALLDDILKEVPSDARENELERKLLEAGLLREIKPPITDFTPYQNRSPVELKCKKKTVSDIINDKDE